MVFLRDFFRGLVVIAAWPLLAWRTTESEGSGSPGLFGKCIIRGLYILPSYMGVSKNRGTPKWMV